MCRFLTFFIFRVGLLCLGGAFMSGVARAQTLTVQNDIQTYATLANTAVTLSGRSELRITGDTAPLSGSTVNLTSPDSWLFLTNIRPSVVNSSYTGIIRINGATPVHNTNCRIVQHADGTVIIPHASTFAGLEVFSGPYFTGTSMLLQNYTSHSNTSLATLADNISSFRLRRGYSVTLAQNANGSGISRNYVAQDGDIEVALLPDELDDAVSFVRVIPWRWVGKKGSCDVAPATLNARWHYNWDNNQTSPLDWEYIPIRQQRWWPGYPNDKRESSHLLGYNEPNNPVEDAYTSLGEGSVDTAIAVWPELQQSGLRLGSPAVTDGGEPWLYEFIDKADAAGLRVDFVAIHFYRCGYSASQLYSWLYNIHVRTGRPLWVTEFNNGANWTTCADPTLAQNATAISGFIDMMNDAPFIERYAVYSNVENVRKVVDSSNILTPAGVVYRDTPSPLSYQQVIPEVPAPPSAHYRFELNARDSSAYGHSAVLQGAAKFTTGRNGQGLSLSGVAASGDHVQLSSRLGDSTDFTFGAWVYPTSSAQWQRIFDLGSSTTRYLFLTPSSGSGTLRFAIKNGSGAEQQLNHTAPLPLNTWTHVAVTINGNTGKLFVNGSPVATNTAMTINPADAASAINYLGRSRFEADPLFAGRMDEVQFLHYALTDAQVAAMPGNAPPQLTNPTLTGPAATQGSPYTGTVAGSATDPNAGDFLTWSRAAGPSWLNVAANGTLSGTPGFGESGANQFILRVTDSAGASALAVLNVSLPNNQGNGTWTSDANGLWSAAAFWQNSFPANGADFTANFSTLNITADRTITLDANRPIGSLLFGDTSGPQNWLLNAANGRVLTLEVSTGTPVITVNQNTATLSVSLDGTSGLTKNGTGTLVLKGVNPLSGTLFTDTNSGSANGGAVRLAAPDAGSSLTGIQIRNNNSGFSTLELDGTSGSVTTPAAAPVILSGRAGTVAAFRNLAGDNTVGGDLALQVGGGNYHFLSEGGSLTLAGDITSNASGSRMLTFRGAGNTVLSGVISNGSATTGIGITKNDNGTLTLSGANTHTGPTVINGGAVTVNGSGVLGTGPITLAAGTVLNLNRNANLTQTVTGAGEIINTNTATVTGDFSGFTGTYTHNSATFSSGFVTATSTSRNAAYHVASVRGAAQGILATGDGNYTLEMGSLTGVEGSLVRGGNTATGTTVLQIGNRNTNDTFAGSINNGATKTIALTKTGTGTFTLSGTNAWTGPTLINGGTLLVNGSTGTSSVTVANSATLGGQGTLGGAVTVQAGGTLAPGAPVGRLTVSNAVVLQAGSTTRLEIDRAAGTHDSLATSGALTLGGQLIVSLTAGSFAPGDSFTVFSSLAISGSFASVNLPVLPAGLLWDTSALGSGRLSVTAAPGSYPAWATGYAFPSGLSGPLADADGDSLANGFEWILGTDPLAGASGFSPQVVVRPLTIQENPSALPGQSWLTLTARVRKVHPGMNLDAVLSPSLTWAEPPEPGAIAPSFAVSVSADFEDRTWYCPVPLEGIAGGRHFMRLRLSTIP